MGFESLLGRPHPRQRPREVRDLQTCSVDVGLHEAELVRVDLEQAVRGEEVAGLGRGARERLEPGRRQQGARPRRRVLQTLHGGGRRRQCDAHGEECVRRSGERRGLDREVDDEPEPAEERRVLVHRRDDLVEVDLLGEGGLRRQLGKRIDRK